jgi:hypothetical protein
MSAGLPKRRYWPVKIGRLRMVSPVSTISSLGKYSIRAITIGTEFTSPNQGRL